MAGPDANLTEIAGTLSYMAPECLACQSHGQAVDMWSFGVRIDSSVIFCVYVARNMFHAGDAVRDAGGPTAFHQF
jgi:serine/threonine protein kinase|eukprot:COSAG01_NODE_31197_length_601_cov_67.256972_1_plen_75_part_00